MSSITTRAATSAKRRTPREGGDPMKTIHLAALALAAVVLFPACAVVDGEGTGEESDLTADSIVGGTIDKAHPSVVGIRFNKGDKTATCSGTLISPTVV